jgi:tetratricopeptide (TPR) repeat protein
MKNKTTASLLSLFLGVFGMQFFYTNRIGLGIMSCVFTFMMGWGRVSFIIGFVNFILFLMMSDNEFNRRYNREAWKEQERLRQQQAQEQRDQERQEREYHRQQERYTVPKEQNREARERLRPTPPPQYQKPTKQNTSQKEDLKQAAMAKFKDFDYQGAIEHFGNALAIDPKDVAVHWNLACCYSLTEQKELAFYHLQKAVELDFKDYEKIKTHEALAYLRVQPEFETFARNGFRMTEDMEHSDILQQLKDLSLKRESGLISEKEFADMSRRLAG